MEKANKIKPYIVGFLSTITGWIGILAVPVIILVILNIVDYITGIMASIYKGDPLTSYRSFKGIAKKICQWLLVLVSALIDWLIIFSVEQLGFTAPFAFLIACAVAIWLSFNETISIIENMKAMEVKAPPFLKPLAKYVKNKVEEKAKIGGDINGSKD